MFLMVLALRLGKTLHELETTLTARELALWIAFDAQSPISDRRGDIQAAQVASAVFQSQGGKVSLGDALLQWNEPDQEQDSIDGLEAFFQSMMA